VTFVGLQVLETYLEDEPCHRINGSDKPNPEYGLVSRKARNPN